MSNRAPNKSIKTAKAGLSQAIKKLTEKIPHTHSTWDYMKSVRFKSCVSEAARYASRKRTTMPKLAAYYDALQEFYQ